MEPGLTQNLPDPALIVKDLNIDVGRPKLADCRPTCSAVADPKLTVALA